MIDARALDGLIDRLGRSSKDLLTDIKRARADIRRAAGTEAKRSAAAVYLLNQGRIAQDLRVSDTELGVEVTGTKKPPTLLAYGATRVKSGLAVRVLRGGQRSILKRAFVVERLKLPFERVGKPRTPIRVLYGPSVADALKNEKVLAPLNQAITARAVKIVGNRLRNLLRG